MPVVSEVQRFSSRETHVFHDPSAKLWLVELRDGVSAHLFLGRIERHGFVFREVDQVLDRTYDEKGALTGCLFHDEGLAEWVRLTPLTDDGRFALYKGPERTALLSGGLNHIQNAALRDRVLRHAVFNFAA
ncbi:MAG: hypothetical protein R3245_12065 [Kiloniellales bacterium]|nr:hypothetical protein [Kiloniellales bacterium]